jgi:hypothetical protein
VIQVKKGNITQKSNKQSKEYENPKRSEVPVPVLIVRFESCVHNYYAHRGRKDKAIQKMPFQAGYYILFMVGADG